MRPARKACAFRKWLRPTFIDALLLNAAAMRHRAAAAHLCKLCSSLVDLIELGLKLIPLRDGFLLLVWLVRFQVLIVPESSSLAHCASVLKCTRASAGK